MKKLLLAVLFISIYLVTSHAQNEFISPVQAEDMVLVADDKDVSPFYISRYEVTNKEYLCYLLWLYNVYLDYPEKYRMAIPDTTVLKDYFLNPLYADHPVVGVSWQQAMDYCVWLTDRYNENV